MPAYHLHDKGDVQCGKAYFVKLTFGGTFQAFRKLKEGKCTHTAYTLISEKNMFIISIMVLNLELFGWKVFVIFFTLFDQNVIIASWKLDFNTALRVTFTTSIKYIFINVFHLA